jgi:hypothetical protein
MIKQLFNDTFDEMEGFTQDLEKEKSVTALIEMKSLWRIMKSVQIKYVKDLDEERLIRLDRIVARLEIKDVVATAFSEHEVVGILTGFKDTCGFRHEQVTSE